MKWCFVIFVFSLCCTPKKREQKNHVSNFEQIDYTFTNGWNIIYSLKINNDGFCIIGDGEQDIDFSLGNISYSEVLILDSLIRLIPFNTYKDSYIEDSVADNFSYKIVIVKHQADTIEKYVYGNAAPTLLNDLSDRLIILKNKIEKKQSDTTVLFISRRGFFPDTFFSDERKFTTPLRDNYK